MLSREDHAGTWPRPDDSSPALAPAPCGSKGSSTLQRRAPPTSTKVGTRGAASTSASTPPPTGSSRLLASSVVRAACKGGTVSPTASLRSLWPGRVLAPAAKAVSSYCLLWTCKGQPGLLVETMGRLQASCSTSMACAAAQAGTALKCFASALELPADDRVCCTWGGIATQLSETFSCCNRPASRFWGLPYKARRCHKGTAQGSPRHRCAQQVKQGLRTSRLATVHSSIMVASVPTRQLVRTASVLQPFRRILMLACTCIPPILANVWQSANAQPPGSSLLPMPRDGA